MRKMQKLIVIPLFVVTLSSCSTVTDWKDNLDQYIFAMRFHQDFNILQLTDIHWNVNTSTASSKKYLSRLIEEVDSHIKEEQGINAKIDLIEFTGDQFMLANTYHVDSFIDFFETKANEYDFKYALTWGNHDRHGLYNPNWLSKRFINASHCLYTEPDDNLYGRSNYVINLTANGEINSETKWQIVNLDSGASFSETPLSVFRNYDYIHKDQTEWWLQEHEKAGHNVPTIAYYHIPQQDNGLAWDEIHNHGATYKNKFFKLELFGDSGKEEYHSDFISTGRNHNLKAAFMGHAHNIDWTVDYNGVVLGLGVKTGPELYYKTIDPSEADNSLELKEGLSSTGIYEKFDLIGASLVTIKDNANFDLEHLYYNLREGTDDFVRWVKW